MIKVKSNAHNLGLMSNRYVCFSFRDNRAIFGRDMANYMFYLENLTLFDARVTLKINQ